MAAKRGLGRGLDSLIPAGNNNGESKDQIVVENKQSNADGKVMVKLSKVEPNRDQPRKAFNEDALEELAESVKQFGVLEPLLVREKNGLYEIIAGERRWRAARKAGIKEVPVVIRNDLSEQEIVEIQLIENIQREDLNPIEEAQAYQRLIIEFNLKQDEVAEKVSKSRVSITNSMRLLKLTEKVQQMVIDGCLSSGHARALIPVEDSQLQIRLAEQIFDEKLSVRQAEKLVKTASKEKAPAKVKEIDKNLETIYKNLEQRVKDKTGTKVSIISKGNKGAGKIEIEFYSNADLEKITQLLING
ncbi:ParB/RepB/Spo0J family partition protein [Butyrivibrio sp. MC2013]|uniref:ParB/RepB/Spo0J family partition protein n=1 Tax=Butyrivibrio sp. MC2013 TaxID=1280686 RepID=UPI00040D042D|nr:ParB/RepB/Spo0J family partition protein [Butyrivibrio sp. MC2013]